MLTCLSCLILGIATSSALYAQGEWELATFGDWQGTLNLQRRKIGHTGWETIRTWSDANATSWLSFDDVALYAAAAPAPTPTPRPTPRPAPRRTPTPTPQPTPKIGSNLDLTGFGLVFADNFNTLSVQAPGDKGSAIWLGHGPYGAASNFSVSHWSWDSKTLRVENGALVNTAWWDQSINNWRSGLISSMDRQRDGFAQRFGYWEARMRMPNAGRGAFPAFWLLAATTIPNHNGIKGYEIDILEWFGQDAPQSADRFAHTIHEWNPDGSQGAGSEGKWVDVADPINTWHTYGCMVTPWWIAFYLDGVCTWTKPVNLDYNNSPLYVMVNYALGGGWPVTGEPYASHGDSALLVDYVYAYAPPAAWPIPRAPNRSLSNAGFESDADGAQEAAGWGEWSAGGHNANGRVVDGGSHSGRKHYRIEGDGPYDLFLSQVVSLFEPGLYSLRAWVKSSGGQSGAYLVVKDYSQDDIYLALPAAVEWTQIEIRDINLTTDASVRIGIYSVATTGQWIELDDVELIKQ